MLAASKEAEIFSQNEEQCMPLLSKLLQNMI